MSITIGNYPFDGPFTNTAALNNHSGVYAILTRPKSGDTYFVIDIGESATVRDRIDGHDRSKQWDKANQGSLHVAAHYCDERTRMAIESTLRWQFKPVCGDR